MLNLTHSHHQCRQADSHKDSMVTLATAPNSFRQERRLRVEGYGYTDPRFLLKFTESNEQGKNGTEGGNDCGTDGLVRIHKKNVKKRE